MKKIKFSSLLICLFWSVRVQILKCQITDNQAEYEIIENITGKSSGYNKQVRIIKEIPFPLPHIKITQNSPKKIRPKSILDVTVRLSLKTVSAIDEKNLIMSSDSYLTAAWHDPKLTWDAQAFDNEYVLIPSNTIWMPGRSFYLYLLLRHI